MSKDVRLSALRAKIRGFQAEGVTFQRMIKRNSGIRKHELRVLKSELGMYARHHLLVYAFIRNKKYHDIESVCRTPVDENLFLNTLKAHSHHVCRNEKGYMSIREWTLDDIRGWFLKTDEGSFVQPELMSCSA